MATFPTTKRSRRGYDADEVDAFLAQARRAYDGVPGERLRASDIRTAAFGMTRGGYDPGSVDAALERLEDAFAARERDEVRARDGEARWYSDARTAAKSILGRLHRVDGARFDRVGALTQGYSRKEVDRFASRLRRYFEDGKPMSVDEVRTVVFRPQRGGYREAQVDSMLDAVTEVMLAVR